MWAITHASTGVLFRDYHGDLFYSEKEARAFLCQMRRLIKVVGTIYYLEYANISIGPGKALGSHKSIFANNPKPFRNKKTSFFNYRKFRFYRNQKRQDACLEEMERLLKYIGPLRESLGIIRLSDMLKLLNKSGIYFIIHRVN